MRLNVLAPASGARKKRKRVGRGASAGGGSTCGRGDKGQNSRSGGGVAPGFEGGQQPLYKRIPVFGFRSRQAQKVGEVRLSDLDAVDGDVADISSLQAAGRLTRRIERARVIDTGTVTRAVTVKGLKLSAGARAAVEAAGGKVED